MSMLFKKMKSLTKSRSRAIDFKRFSKGDFPLFLRDFPVFLGMIIFKTLIINGYFVSSVFHFNCALLPVHFCNYFYATTLKTNVMTTKTTFHTVFFSSIIFIFASCEDPKIPSHYDGPPKEYIISEAQAQEMYSSYSQRRVPIIQKYEDSIAGDSSTFTPTRYAEYDYEVIKQYIAYIEHEAKRANVDIQTLRFYLSNYPDSEKFSDGAVVKYPKRNSFFVLPTMDFEGKNVGFSVKEINGKYSAVPIKGRNAKAEKNRGEKLKDSAVKINEAGFFPVQNDTAQGGGSSSLILNDSHISPPPYGSDDFGGTD